MRQLVSPIALPNLYIVTDNFAPILRDTAKVSSYTLVPFGCSYCTSVKNVTDSQSHLTLATNYSEFSGVCSIDVVAHATVCRMMACLSSLHLGHGDRKYGIVSMISHTHLSVSAMLVFCRYELSLDTVVLSRISMAAGFLLSLA